MEQQQDSETTSYGEDYFSSTYGRDGPRPLGLHWWSVRWYAAMAARCLERTGGTRLLEVGCGPGYLLSRLEQRFETWGIDVSPYAIQESARFAPRSHTLVADLDAELPGVLDPGSFDLVMAKYVFEHLRDPRESVGRLCALLRPGGTLFFSVPYTGSLGARRKGDDWFASTVSDPSHCSLWDREQWLALVQDVGLEMTQESADGWWDVPYLRRIPGWLQLPFVIAPTALSCLSGRALLPARWGENLLIFARKPGQPR